MLSDHAIWATAGIRYSPAAYGLTGPQPVTLAGLRAVEAAVRADQIKRDIEKVMGSVINFDVPGPRTQIAAILRAQLPEGSTDE